jgi:hypothetical protein
MSRAAALLSALVLLAAPGAAGAATTSTAAASGAGGVPISPSSGATNPLSGGVSPVSPTPTPTTTPTVPVVTNATQTSGSSSLSGGSALAIVIGALVVLGGISFYIWRDARRRAPVRGAEVGLGVTGRRPGSKAPPKPRKLSAAERKRRKRGRAPRH